MTIVQIENNLISLVENFYNTPIALFTTKDEKDDNGN